MRNFLTRYVWAYLTYDQMREKFEWAVFHSPVNTMGLGMPTPHEMILTRPNIRYVVKSDEKLSESDAMKIVRSLYAYEFSG